MIDTSCTVFRPLTWSSRDTVETVEGEIAGHNARWLAQCAPEAQP